MTVLVQTLDNDIHAVEAHSVALDPTDLFVRRYYQGLTEMVLSWPLKNLALVTVLDGRHRVELYRDGVKGVWV